MFHDDYTKTYTHINMFNNNDKKEFFESSFLFHYYIEFTNSKKNFCFKKDLSELLKNTFKVLIEKKRVILCLEICNYIFEINF